METKCVSFILFKNSHLQLTYFVPEGEGDIDNELLTYHCMACRLRRVNCGEGGKSNY